MKNLPKIVVTLLFTLLYSVAEAQIIFSEKIYDFGTIAEDGGTKCCNFHFKNISDKPIIIVSAHSSCGCTKADFARKPTLPDSTSVIKVTFNPLNYPGKFARKITIVTNEGILEEPLLITGFVTPRTKSIEEEFPITMGGGVRVKSNAHSFGYLEHGKVKQSDFELINHSSKSVTIAIENNHSELEFFHPAEVKAGERANINFTALLPEKSAIYGSLEYSATLLIDGRKAEYPFIINGLAIDSRDERSNYSSQMIAISEKSIKFGTVKRACTHYSREIEVTNGGDRELAIRKIELSGEGFDARLQGDKIIKAGEKRRLIVDINPSKLPFGAVVERLRIVSNDPLAPVMTIRVSAVVEK